MSIQETDRESAEAAKNPAGRVSLAQIEAAIKFRFDLNLGDCVGATAGHIVSPNADSSLQLSRTSLCVLVMSNDFNVIGKSTPLDPANFNVELGRKFAYEDAIRQLWPLMAFARASGA